MPAKLLLKRIHVEGFRGILRPAEIECGRQATLLFARNGQGKSSFLGAIEWCLFGELQYQSPENRTCDELVNIHSNRAMVRVELEGADGSLIVERSRVVRKLASKLTVTTPEGEKLEDKAAEACLFRALGLSFADFFRAIYLHQESIRGLLIDEPRVRDEALDRLFGLEKLRDVLAAIPVSVVKDAIAEIQTKKLRATDKLSGAADQAEQMRGIHLKDALEAGFEEKDLALPTALEIVNDIQEALAAACMQDGQQTPALLPVNETDDLEKIARRVKETTKNRRLAGSRGSPVDAATTRLVNIRQLNRELADAHNEQAEAAKTVSDHRKQFGDPETFGARKTKIQAQIASLEKQREMLGLQDRVFADAIAYLKAIPAAACPVCEQGIEPARVLGSLESRVSSDQKLINERISNDIRAAKMDLDTVEEAAKEARRLETKRQIAVGNLGKIAAKAEALVGKFPLADLAGRLEQEGERVLASLEGLKKQQELTEKALQAIDADVDRLRLVHKFLRADEQFALIREKSKGESDADAANVLEEDLERLLKLEESLNAIVQAISKVSRERATAAIEDCRDAISFYYRQLCNHQYFDGIRIDVEDRSVKGVQKNSYTIRAFSTTDGKDTLASSRLSVGQMNCVALSVHLALKEVLTHNLGFIILDDPSQCLDLPHKDALVKSLAKMSESAQLLIATEDQEMEKMLAVELAGSGTQAYSLRWSPKNGTAVAPFGEKA
jgi:DNA repair exonuclease SbcCD ATPase subunit